MNQPAPNTPIKNNDPAVYMPIQLQIAAQIATGLSSNLCPDPFDGENFNSWSEWVSQMSLEMASDLISTYNKSIQ